MARGATGALLAALWLACVPAPAHATERDIVFRPITAESGLVQASVTALLQDSGGYLWIGTQAGLQRFDGHQMRPAGLAVQPGAPSERLVTALAEGPPGTLWVGTATVGLARLDLAADRYLPVPPTRHREAAAARQVLALLHQPGRGLWIGSHAGIEFLADGASERRIVQEFAAPGSAFGPRLLLGFALTEDGRVHAAMRDGVWRLDPDAPPERLPGSADIGIEAIAAAEGGGLWIKAREGLYAQPPAGPMSLRLATDPLPADAPVHPHLVADAEGGLWYGIAGRGLMRFDTRQGTTRLQAAGHRLPGLLPADSYTALHVDRTGLLWVGTQYSGLWSGPSEGSRFRLIVDDALGGGPRANNVRAIAESGGQIYVGTEGDGLKRLDRRDGSLQPLAIAPGKARGEGRLRVFELRPARDGGLWAATSAGLWRIGTDGTSRPVGFDSIAALGPAPHAARTVLETAAGELWVGTQAHGMLRGSVDGPWQPLGFDREDPNSLSNNLVLVCEQDSSGRIWVGTIDGLNLYLPARNGFLRLQHRTGDPDSLPSNMVRAIHESRDGVLWIGTHGGLARLDRLDGERAWFTRFGEAEGLPDATVYAIEEDGDGRLWLSGNRGLSAFDPKTGQFQAYGPEDGLQGYEFNGGASTRLASGELAFGGIEGINLFRGEAVRPSAHRVPLALTRLTLDGRDVTAPGPEGLVLDHGRHLVGIEFTALDFRAPGRNRHAYRLLGLDSTWIEGRGMGRVSFAGLPPGAYTLELRGSNSDGEWNPAVLSLPLDVQPPWWDSTLARVGYGLAALVLAALLWQFQRRRRRQQSAHIQALREREMRLQLSLWGSGDGFWDWDITSNTIHRHGLDRVLGLPQSAASLAMPDWRQHEIHPEDLPLVNQRIQRHLQGESDFYESEHRLRNAEGTWTWVLARGQVVERDSEGRPLRCAGTVRNIEAQRRQQHDARIAAEVIRNMSEAVAVLDERLRFRQINPAFERACGWRAGELIGSEWARLNSPLHDSAFYRARSETILRAGRWHGECWQRGRDGGDRLYTTDATRVRDRADEAPYVVVVQSDITERKRAELELRQLANYDTLTGLANRALLMQQLGLALPKARAEGRRLAMLFVDLDRFKQINDSLGHATGDELLKAVGERMRARLPAHAFLARQGGDEFTVVIEDLAETSEAEQLARSLLDAFATPIEVRGHEVRVTPSIGIALYPEHAARPEDLLRSADAAMYAAKAAGRNTWRMFHADMAASGRLRVALEQSVARAEVSDEFSLDYQPIYHIVDRRPVAVEALLRWRHPEFGLVSPDDFVPLLEESGLIVEIGRKVLRMALGQLADWRRRGLEGLRMAVNLSALQLLRTELPGEIRQALGDAGLPGEALELELTESLLMSNPEQAIRTLAELKTIGVTIAVDDFGTGYSSLAYLKRLPIDKLKIDREFIGDLLHDPDDATIVEMIIAMARALGIRATAEGVELDGQLRFLKRHGCEEIQGFLMCRPLPAAACFEALQHAYE